MNDNFLNSANAPYVAELFYKYSQDPNSVDSSWGNFFNSLNENDLSVLGDFGGPEWKKRPSNIIDGISFDKATRLVPNIKVDSFRTSTLDSIRTLRLIRAYHINGHLTANLDPLNLSKKEYHPELDYKSYGLTDDDLDKEIFIDGSLGLEKATLKEIIKILKETYSSSIGVEFLHMQSPEQKQWVQERIEEVRNKTIFTTEGKKAIYNRLVESELFEQYLDKKFLGTKRYGIEGGESMIPGIEQIVKQACIAEVENVFIGTAHRGRLTLLSTVLGMPYKSILSKFQGYLNDPNEVLGSGDVKYHLGVSSDREFEGKKIHISMVPNPSHLEAVDPVVMGKVRAKQTQLNDKTNDKVFGLLIHGDAAMAGQGIVAETFAMSQLVGFRTGGTIHFVINNQIGFTTSPRFARSSPYPSDLGKVIESPILHCNGDDPEAVVHCAKIAIEFRQKFNKDVVIDMICYRRFGHNEGDEPSFTQPLMYKKIRQHPTTLNVYGNKLIKENVITQEEFDKMKKEFKNLLDEQFKTAKDYKPKIEWYEGTWSRYKPEKGKDKRGKSGVDLNKLIKISEKINNIPPEINLHKTIGKILDLRKKSVLKKKGIDWGTAEALAFGSLLEEGYPVRLVGQDSGRGTFSQRHSVLRNQVDNSRYIPLNNISNKQKNFEPVDSF